MRRLRLSGNGRAATTAGGAIGAVLIAGLFSACSATPYAASVGSSTIKETALSTELRWSAAAKDYTTALSGNYSQLYSVTLTQAGSTPNSYSSAWSAYTLSQIIQGRAVRLAVARKGKAPSSDLYVAALGGIEIENLGVTGPHNNGGVTQMPPAYLVNLTQRLADHADLETALSATQLQSIYNNYQSNFYTQVCVRQASVSVAGADGSVDFKASATQAAAVAHQIVTSAGSSSSGAPSGSGASNCYTHPQLDAQSAGFINTVVALAPGHASIQRTGYGYQVTAVSSRQLEPLEGPVAQVLTTLVYDLEQPSSDTTLRQLLAHTKVRINPAFGTWNGGAANTLASVVAPSASATTPVGSSASAGAAALGGSLGATGNTSG